jgi:hypothetical protein
MATTIDGVNYPSLLPARLLSKINPALVAAEREFLRGRKWTDIKVRIEYVDGRVVEGPHPVKPAKVL